MLHELRAKPPALAFLCCDLCFRKMQTSAWRRLASFCGSEGRHAARKSAMARSRYSSTSAWADLAGASPSPESLIKRFGPPAATHIEPTDFRYCPDFLNGREQQALLRLALWKLDRVDPELRRTGRRRRRAAGQADHDEPVKDLQSLFALSEGRYGFEEVRRERRRTNFQLTLVQGHFDSVITQYREALLSTFPPAAPPLDPAYSDILRRIYALLPNKPTTDDLPPPATTTHALHLAPEGQILPHVDNIQASGSVIIGVSLGAERIMRLECDGEGWDVRLKSGSVYVQRWVRVRAAPYACQLVTAETRYDTATSTQSCHTTTAISCPDTVSAS